MCGFKSLVHAVFPQIGKLSRWQVIDMVRTISTEAAKSGGGVSCCGL